MQPMNIELDPLLNRLRDAQPDRRLDEIERRVWERIENDRLEAAGGPAWRWRAALAAAMLCVGVFAGIPDGTRARATSPFAIHSSLAPSTLLEDGP